ncbi:hypothetical protein FRX31_022374 [Thalictrum thalictroides]|uniref:Secreted protein n=1 Tax=Thalictrum thalictroides TaxID=46969 RepID=A0A7J6VSH5_THATH|nr:hypothetical protein FRX31_022374 [Thalictrum thalictroides]
MQTCNCRHVAVQWFHLAVVAAHALHCEDYHDTFLKYTQTSVLTDLRLPTAVTRAWKSLTEQCIGGSAFHPDVYTNSS